MIIYHIGHFGALSKALLLHFNLHKNDNCVFLFDTILCNQETKDFLKGFTDKVKNFANVVTYSDDVFKDEQSYEGVQNNIDNFFTKLFELNRVDIYSAKKIYTMFDTFNAFGGYCLLHNISLTFVDAFGMFGKDRYYLNGEHWVHYDRFLFSVGALGYNCKSANCDFLIKDTSVKLIENGKINFDSLKNNLDAVTIDWLLDLYGFSNDDSVVELSNLVIFSSGWIIAKRKMSREEYFYYYQLLLDFFCDSDGKILLKPHPNINFTQAEADKYFSNSLVLPNYFPSEFIPFLKKFQVRQVLSTSSSGIPSGIYACKYFISFEVFYEATVFKRLYFALQLEKFFQPAYNKFFHHGLHNKFVWGMQDSIFSKNKLRSVWASLKNFDANSITIIDNYLWNGVKDKEKLINALRTLDNNAIIIFLDSKDTCNYYFDEYKEGLSYIRTISFVKESSVKHSDNQVEKIHVFCKDMNILRSLNSFRYKEYMQNIRSTYYSC